MPPDHDHFNGSVILDAGSAMRGIVSPIPVGLRRIRDREAGAGANRFFFRLRMFQLVLRPVLVRPRPGSLAFRVGVLTADPGTGLGFALVPCHLGGQAPGVR